MSKKVTRIAVVCIWLTSFILGFADFPIATAVYLIKYYQPGSNAVVKSDPVMFPVVGDEGKGMNFDLNTLWNTGNHNVSNIPIDFMTGTLLNGDNPLSSMGTPATIPPFVKDIGGSPLNIPVISNYDSFEFSPNIYNDVSMLVSASNR